MEELSCAKMELTAVRNTISVSWETVGMLRGIHEQSGILGQRRSMAGRKKEHEGHETSLGCLGDYPLNVCKVEDKCESFVLIFIFILMPPCLELGFERFQPFPHKCLQQKRLISL